MGYAGWDCIVLNVIVMIMYIFDHSVGKMRKCYLNFSFNNENFLILIYHIYNPSILQTIAKIIAIISLWIRQFGSLLWVFFEYSVLFLWYILCGVMLVYFRILTALIGFYIERDLIHAFFIGKFYMYLMALFEIFEISGCFCLGGRQCCCFEVVGDGWVSYYFIEMDFCFDSYSSFHYIMNIIWPLFFFCFQNLVVKIVNNTIFIRIVIIFRISLRIEGC
jgi:hypothetical protein